MFSDKYYLLIKPKLKADLSTEFKSCLNQINNFINQNDLHRDWIVKQSIFINIDRKLNYIQTKNDVKILLDSFFKKDIPPTSFIAQSPQCDFSCAVELIILKNESPRIKIKRKKVNNTSYTVIYYSSIKEIHAAGLTAPLDCKNTQIGAQIVFEEMEEILKAEQLNFGDVVRQWNYIEKILENNQEKEGARQNYQIFNDIRSKFYSKYQFHNGYPAATGIGMKAGGTILEFVAVSNSSQVNIIPIRNPQQINAYAYSEKSLIGLPIEGNAKKTSPKFERAKFISVNDTAKIYISGTAAIRGEESVGTKNASDQTIITIENIEMLLNKYTLAAHGIHVNSHLPKLSHLRVYIKNQSDLNAVKKVCEKYYASIPILFLISDICRDDLLVECEGIAE